ncbi:C6 zinc finger domain protein [Lipomyces orientalis]|uniref:C6 zinc finger domain protein n=1 Tax=Lipomyces orientalis TaxID=1233043 RepID=A0ACC3TEI9_9ASCO
MSKQTATAKPQRVLACVLCQQRKIKCDRKFPCANCVRACAQCVPATLALRQRRRRFPERELLERLRHYEGLLRQNNIQFEPLHGPAAEQTSPSEDGRGCDSLDDAHSEGPVSGRTDHLSREKTAVSSKPVSLWHAMSQRGKTLDPEDDDDNGEGDDDDNDSGFLHDNDDVREDVIKKAWDQVYESESHLLFGSPKTNVDLSTLHPEQVQIFRLWQIYLENVNPLLKVTHTPTLQARIIDAVSDVANMSPTLEALIFSIYCVSILSLAEDECRTLFGSPRKDLLTSYQFGCRQALLNCRVLRSSDRDCLIALYLYLVSVRPETDPRSLSSMLGVAIRIAQRMGIHNDSTYAGCTALEAEMRRRLWWSLVIFDSRICEMSDYKTTMLAPTWDCRTPLNVNDSEIRPEMKTPPAIHERPSEALFAVVRSELADFVRHSTFHLDFTNPSLKTIAKDTQYGPVLEGGELIALEKTMEDKYLAFCNPENPLHFMTIWMTRGHLAKNRLLEHYSRHSTSSVQQTDTQREAAISHALSMLECDTKLMTSPLTKGYLWLLHFYFPFTAYIHILQGLRKRPPTEDHAEKAWEVMSDNYEARVMNANQGGKLIFRVFSQIVLQAWEAREALFRQQDKPLEPPRIVSDIRNKVTQMTSNFSQNSNIERPNGAVGINSDEFPMPMPIDFGGHGPSYGTLEQGSTGSGPWGYPDIPWQATTDVDMNQFDWTAIDWNSMHARSW